MSNKIMKQKAEEQTIEVKSANKGCPKRLYDTLSSFSNQDSGGILLFGLDETQNFNVVGVYDLPADVFKSKNPRTNWRTSMVRIGLYFIFLRSLLTINAISKTKASPATPIIYCMMISSVFLF